MDSFNLYSFFRIKKNDNIIDDLVSAVVDALEQTSSVTLDEVLLSFQKFLEKEIKCRKGVSTSCSIGTKSELLCSRISRFNLSNPRPRSTGIQSRVFTARAQLVDCITLLLSSVYSV